MDLQSFTLANYRSFVEPTTIELRPLTLLFGYNNAGKSALLRALPLLAASLRGQPGVPLALDTPAARGGGFRDLLSSDRLNPPRQMSIGMSFAKPSTNNADRLGFRWIIRDLPDLRRQVIEKFEIADAAGKALISALWTIEDSPSRPFGSEYELSLNGRPQGGARLEFAGLLPTSRTIRNLRQLPETELPPESRPALQTALDYCTELAESGVAVEWLGAVRTPPAPERLSAGAAHAIGTGRLQSGRHTGPRQADWRPAAGGRLGLV